MARRWMNTSHPGRGKEADSSIPPRAAPDADWGRVGSVSARPAKGCSSPCSRCPPGDAAATTPETGPEPRRFPALRAPDAGAEKDEDGTAWDCSKANEPRTSVVTPGYGAQRSASQPFPRPRPRHEAREKQQEQRLKRGFA